MSPAPLRFSVIVPTYDRVDQVERCLEALAAQRVGGDRFETIVVDDGGAMSLDRLAAAHREPAVRLIRQANGGPASARNAGAAVARGELLVFLDDDCLPEPDWLAAIDARAAAHPGAAVGGRTVNALPGNAYSTASHLLSEFLVAQLNPDPDDARFHASNNFAVPATGFRDMGGFDASFPDAAGEDREFCDRWRGDGRRLVSAPDAVVRHAHAMTLRSFCGQHVRYGRSALRFHATRARREAEPIPLAPLSFYSGMLRHPLRSQPRGGIRHSLLIGLSQAVYAAGYFGARLVARGRR